MEGDAHGPPPVDAWLTELGVDVVAAAGGVDEAAFSRDVVMDGTRRFDLRITIAWVEGLGLSLWAYYGFEGMEIPRRELRRMLRADFDYPFLKFALTDDDRPMLMSELPAAALTRDELGRGLVRLAVAADRLMEETAHAVADRGILPDWSEREPRYPRLLERYRDDVESSMPPWSPPLPRRPRRGLITRLLGRQ